MPRFEEQLLNDTTSVFCQDAKDFQWPTYSY